MRATEMQSFDTHKFIKMIQNAGLKEKEAEAIVEVLVQSRSFDLANLASKEQLEHVRQVLEANLSEKIHASVITMLKWMLPFLLTIIGLIVTLLLKGITH